MTRPPSRRGVEVISGVQGSGRSLLLARRIGEVAPSRGPCLLVDPGDHWTGARGSHLPEGTVVIRPRSLSARGVDPSEVVAIAMHRLPGSVVGIDDSEALGIDDRGWARVYAAASASGCLLLLVLAERADGQPVGARMPGPGRVAALAAFGA